MDAKQKHNTELTHFRVDCGCKRDQLIFTTDKRAFKTVHFYIYHKQEWSSDCGAVEIAKSDRMWTVRDLMLEMRRFRVEHLMIGRRFSSYFSEIARNFEFI